MSKYVLAIDQSTQGTKALIFDSNGRILGRKDMPHEQKISPEGYVSHDPMEIYRNTLAAAKKVIAATGIDSEDISAVGISNQRETALVWDRDSGLPVNDAVVWQCSRGAAICVRQEIMDIADSIKGRTGLNLSPYFSAAKIAWILEHSYVEGKKLCAGTIDSWLIFKLTAGRDFKTDYSNASRTQLFNIRELCWDQKICGAFGISADILPEVCFSDSVFGETDFEGLLPHKVPICGVMGDSHAALFGQGCLEPGMVKATYGTGSSVMMNVGEAPIFGDSGVVSSLAWGMNGKVNYVLEGNINYTGAVTRWIVDDLKLLNSSKEAGMVAMTADPSDTTYLVPAFTGLGAPYWRSDVKATLWGMSRTTGRAELVKAAEDCIAFQIADIVRAMSNDAGINIGELRVDGGPTKDKYLMQCQSDILDIPIAVPADEELSAIGAAYAAGISAKIFDNKIFSSVERTKYYPQMDNEKRNKAYSGWLAAVRALISAK